MKRLNKEDVKLIMRQALREGYLEINRDAVWIPVWVVISGSPPIEGARPTWEDGSLVVWDGSMKKKQLGIFDLSGAQVTEAPEKLELSVTLQSSSVLLFHVPMSVKSLHKWAVQMGKLSNSLPGIMSPTSSVNAQDPETRQLERTLNNQMEELSFAKCLTEWCTAQVTSVQGKSILLEKRVKDLRLELENRKKMSLATGTSSSPSRSASANPLTAATATGGPVVGVKLAKAHHEGCSVSKLLEALRAKNSSPSTTAKHLYSALGHRPHEDEAAQHLLTPGTVSLIQSLPKVRAEQQRDELVTFISKDDPFALQVLRDYSSLFLRMRGLDVDLALRRLLYHFKLPKESQQISRVIRAFAESYVEKHCNLQEHDHGSSAFPVQPDRARHYGPGQFIGWTDAESVEVIVFALVMLNGDLHNPENSEKMTKQQFVDNITRSGAKVVPSGETLQDWYVRIRDDPILFDNTRVFYPDAVRKAHVECKVSGVPGLRMWTRVWAVLCENYDSTAVRDEDRTVQSVGNGLLYLCKGSRDESTVYMTFPLRRTVVLESGGKREFSLSQPNVAGNTGGVGSGGAVGSSAAGGTLRKGKSDDMRVKFRCKSDGDFALWMRAFHYLLNGGYGFWYPQEITRDDDDDEVHASDPSAEAARKQKRRVKKSTLKKKKKKEPSVGQPSAAGGEEQVDETAKVLEFN